MFRMNGITRWHGCQGAYMFRMNGQGYCSGQALSTYIHVGNSAVACMLKRQQVQVSALSALKISLIKN